MVQPRDTEKEKLFNEAQRMGAIIQEHSNDGDSYLCIIKPAGPDTNAVMATNMTPKQVAFAMMALIQTLEMGDLDIQALKKKGE